MTDYSIDPNSGAASQPGGYVAPGLAEEAPEAKEIETEAPREVDLEALKAEGAAWAKVKQEEASATAEAEAEKARQEQAEADAVAEAKQAEAEAATAAEKAAEAEKKTTPKTTAPKKDLPK